MVVSPVMIFDLNHPNAGAAVAAHLQLIDHGLGLFETLSPNLGNDESLLGGLSPTSLKNMSQLG